MPNSMINFTNYFNWLEYECLLAARHEISKATGANSDDLNKRLKIIRKGKAGFEIKSTEPSDIPLIRKAVTRKLNYYARK